MSHVVEVKSLQKNFGKFQALKNISFEVSQGEVVGFIGPNGAGKSTTIRTLLGIIRSSGGSAQIFGKDVWAEAIDIHKKIAYVPGDVYLWPNLSGGEIIDLFIKLQGSGDKKKRDDLIQKFELDPKKKARSYSKGNRQKIALIAALSCQADLYIFDEPTSGLDPLMEAIFQEEVNQLKAKNKSILLSSHILSEVEKLADRVVVIRRGEIIETGTLDQLRHFTQYTYKLETKEQPVSLEGLPGVSNLKIEGQQSVFQADSDKIGEILTQLIPYGVTKLESTPPTLEELFMRDYQGK